MLRNACSSPRDFISFHFKMKVYIRIVEIIKREERNETLERKRYSRGILLIKRKKFLNNLKLLAVLKAFGMPASRMW